MTTASSFRVRLLGEAEYAAWDAFVATQARTGSIYSTAAYLDILCRAAGGTFSIAAIEDDGALVAGMGVYRQRIHGHEVITRRMLLHYNGIVLRDELLAFEGSPSQRLAVLDAFCEFLGRQKAAAVILNCRDGAQDFRPFLDRDWQVKPSYTIVVPTADTAQLWHRFDRNVRRMVRRAEAAGCTVSPDNDFDALYRSHEEVHRRKGAPLYLARQAFARYVDELLAARLAVIFTARLANGTPAATQLVLLGEHRCSHTTCAGSFAAHLAPGTAYLLRWRTFVALEALGYTANDLTNATRGRVTSFKEQFGGALAMNMAVRSPSRMSYRLAHRGVQGYQTLRKGARRRLRDWGRVGAGPKPG
jgi:hypothetical protein